MSNYNIYDRKTFSTGAVIVRSGENAYNAYLIQSGTAIVYKDEPTGHKAVADLEPGDIIGDMAIIRKSKHLSTVLAAETLVAVVIPPGHIEKCIRDADPLLKTLIKGLIRRIDRINAEA
jgi:CRP-like cAMP-binding protein